MFYKKLKEISVKMETHKQDCLTCKEESSTEVFSDCEEIKSLYKEYLWYEWLQLAIPLMIFLEILGVVLHQMFGLGNGNMNFIGIYVVGFWLFIRWGDFRKVIFDKYL